MTYKTLSAKQREIALFHSDGHSALICDGAVRSGKTSVMTGAFVLWAMTHFDGRNFGICGRAVQVAERNIIKPFIQDTAADGEIRVRYLRSQSVMIVEMPGHTNCFYLFGGKDEASYTLIQGITLAGILFDEVALMPRSFVEQGIARTLSVDDAKLWFNCNPESPAHWFYEEWIKQPEKHNAKYLHFLMTDNPGLSDKAIERAASGFSGVFYDRYIKGEWVKAEGLIYPMFDGARNVFGDGDAPPKKEGVAERWYISCDYGTQNPFAALLWREYDGVFYAVDEYYHDGRKSGIRTDAEHMDALLELAGERKIDTAVIDPGAASMKATLYQRCEWPVWDARNEVVPGISNTATALKRGIIRFHERCENAIREFGLYAWDEKAKEDRPVKENDHCLDAVRYFVQTVARLSYIWDDGAV